MKLLGWVGLLLKFSSTGKSQHGDQRHCKIGFSAVPYRGRLGYLTLRRKSSSWQRGTCVCVCVCACVHVCVERRNAQAQQMPHWADAPHLLRGRITRPQQRPGPRPPPHPDAASAQLGLPGDPRPQESHGSVPEDDHTNGEAHSLLFQGSDEGPWVAVPPVLPSGCRLCPVSAPSLPVCPCWHPLSVCFRP